MSVNVATIVSLVHIAVYLASASSGSRNAATQPISHLVGISNEVVAAGSPQQEQNFLASPGRVFLQFECLLLAVIGQDINLLQLSLPSLQKSEYPQKRTLQNNQKRNSIRVLPTLQIVEHLDVIKDIVSGLFLCLVSFSADMLTTRQLEEALSDRIIVAVSSF